MGGLNGQESFKQQIRRNQKPQTVKLESRHTAFISEALHTGNLNHGITGSNCRTQESVSALEEGEATTW